MKQINYSDIIREWFSRLEHGYALPPYTTKQLAVLRTVLQEQEVEDPEEKVQKIAEPEAPPQDRFIAKSEPYMQSAEEFTKYILGRYVGGSQQVLNLEDLYRKIMSLPPEYFQQVVKLISKNTERKLSGGTFKMGKYERVLYEFIRSTVSVPSGSSEALWLAMLYNGKMRGGNSAGSEKVYSDVSVPGGEISVKKNVAGPIDFGAISAELLDNFQAILGIAQMFGQEVQTSMSREQINQLFNKLQDPAVVQELRTLISKSQSSEVEATRKLGAKLSNLLDGADVARIPAIFIDNLNQYMIARIRGVTHWSIINRPASKVHLQDTKDLAKVLVSIPEKGNIARGIAQIGNRIYVNGNLIQRQIVK